MTPRLITPKDLLEARSSAQPHLPAHQVDGRILTFGQWQAEALAAAAELESSGIRSGDGVLLRFDQAHFDSYAVAYIAVHLVGAVPLPAPIDLRPDELMEVARAGRARAIVEIGAERRRPSVRPIDGFAGDPWDPAISEVLFTSGTTGLPRGVQCPFDELAFDYDRRLISIADRSVEAHSAAFGTNYAQEMLRGPLLWGSHVVTVVGATGNAFLNSIIEDRVNTLRLTPTAASALVRSARGAAFHSVSTISVSSASSSPDLLAKLQQVFPQATIVNQYSSTESGRAKLKSVWGRDPARALGRPVEGTEVRIARGQAEDGRYVGEIELRHVSAGVRSYVTSPGKIEAGAWIATGDIGYLDADGYVFLIDRAKDLINVGGRKVSPLAVEEALLRHPMVSDVGVCGVPHPTLGEVVAAIVVLTPGSEPLSHDELSSSLREHERPRSVVYSDSLPRNRAGKLLRSRIRDVVLTSDIVRRSTVSRDDGLTQRFRDFVALALELRGRDADLGDSWYEAGGDSLAAMELMAMVEDEWGVELESELFGPDHRMVDILQTIQRNVGVLDGEG